MLTIRTGTSDAALNVSLTPQHIKSSLLLKWKIWFKRLYHLLQRCRGLLAPHNWENTTFLYTFAPWSISNIFGYILTVTAKVLHTDLLKMLQYKVSANITIFVDIAITVLYLKPKAHTNIHTGSDGNHDNIAACASSSPTLSILCLLSVSFCFCYVFWLGSGSFPQTFAEEKLT